MEVPPIEGEEGFNQSDQEYHVQLSPLPTSDSRFHHLQRGSSQNVVQSIVQSWRPTLSRAALQTFIFLNFLDSLALIFFPKVAGYYSEHLPPDIIFRSQGILLATVSFLVTGTLKETQLQRLLVFSIVFYSIGSMTNLLMHLLVNSEGTGQYECWIRVFFNIFWLLGIGGLRLETR